MSFPLVCCQKLIQLSHKSNCCLYTCIFDLAHKRGLFQHPPNAAVILDPLFCFFVKVFIVFIHSSPELGGHLYDHYFDSQGIFSLGFYLFGESGGNISFFILLDFL